MVANFDENETFSNFLYKRIGLSHDIELRNLYIKIYELEITREQIMNDLDARFENLNCSEQMDFFEFLLGVDDRSQLIERLMKRVERMEIEIAKGYKRKSKEVS